MKDVAPNFATAVMGIKDKMAGGNEYTPIWKSPESASPQNIEAFFHGRIDNLKKTVEMQKNNGDDSFDTRMEIYHCQKGRNVANAIRLNGPTALVRQIDRWSAADTAAGIITEPVYDKDGNYSEERAETKAYVTRHLAAALGHKTSIRELKKQQEEK